MIALFERATCLEQVEFQDINQAIDYLDNVSVMLNCNPLGIYEETTRTVYIAPTTIADEQCMRKLLNNYLLHFNKLGFNTWHIKFYPLDVG